MLYSRSPPATEMEISAAQRDSKLADRRLASIERICRLGFWKKRQVETKTGSHSKMLKAVSRAKRNLRSQTSAANIIDGDNRSVESIANHFESVLNFNDSSIEINTSERKANLGADNQESPFTLGLVNRMIDHCANGKAAGIDEISIEAIKASPAARSAVYNLLNLCWHLGATPRSWNHARLIPIFKKGDPTKAGNYRPISVNSVLRKIAEKCLLGEINSQMKTLDNSQFGFRQGHSTLDAMLALQLTLSNVTRKEAIILTWDIKGAYDRVPRDKLCTWLNEAGLHGRNYLLTKSMLLETRFTAEIGPDKSTPREIRGGVVQGSSLSPTLFNYTLNPAPEWIRRNKLGALFRGNHLGLIMFADDLATVAKDESDACQILRTMEEFADRHLITWAPEKCTFLSKHPRALTLNNVTLTRESKFKYLGFQIKESGISIHDHVEKLIKMAWSNVANSITTHTQHSIAASIPPGGTAAI
jgi:hypothetical protein